MTILEIVKKHLIDNGYDGLYNQCAECACLAVEMEPCGGLHTSDCEAGYLRKCDENCDHEDDWHIQGER